MGKGTCIRGASRGTYEATAHGLIVQALAMFCSGLFLSGVSFLGLFPFLRKKKKEKREAE